MVIVSYLLMAGWVLVVWLFDLDFVEPGINIRQALLRKHNIGRKIAHRVEVHIDPWIASDEGLEFFQTRNEVFRLLLRVIYMLPEPFFLYAVVHG